jgi:putative colanic acid biosynthesis acetyltransferase WcaF
MTTNLQHYDEHNKAYGQGIGASKLKQILWFFCSVLFVRNPLHPFSCVRKWTLQLFGAKIGKGTIIRSGVQIKYPWKLKMGNHVWIGENSWIDNLAKVEIGDHACVSQGAMLCTGNHNYLSPGFELIAKPIVLENAVWVGAKAVVCPGVTAFSHAMLTVGSVATSNMEPYSVYQGNPAQLKRKRVLRSLS